MDYRKLSKTARLLLALASKVAEQGLDITEALLTSGGSVRRLAKNMADLDREEYDSAFYGLRRSGLIRKVNENQFLITPKGIAKARLIEIGLIDRSRRKWGGKWFLVSFDIPESRRSERGIFRSAVKRMGFVGLQKSLFIAPFADLEKLAQLRDYLGIADYVTFFVAETSPFDDDGQLRRKFDL